MSSSPPGQRRQHLVGGPDLGPDRVHAGLAQLRQAGRDLLGAVPGVHDDRIDAGGRGPRRGPDEAVADQHQLLRSEQQAGPAGPGGDQMVDRVAEHRGVVVPDRQRDARPLGMHHLDGRDADAVGELLEPVVDPAVEQDQAVDGQDVEDVAVGGRDDRERVPAHAEPPRSGEVEVREHRVVQVVESGPPVERRDAGEEPGAPAGQQPSPGALLRGPPNGPQGSGW